MDQDSLFVVFDGIEKQSFVALDKSTHKGIPNMPSPVIIGDELFLVSENGIARCLDSKTGDVS